jgi:hypothetical protein
MALESMVGAGLGVAIVIMSALVCLLTWLPT